ncbi:O-antigen ligase family protein [Tautonia rosea]|uniref:O-antigen ligase family protein n=1 Tax=Tautonia rosea TaxID=2728037 RepID=UPI001472710D|nr:O-antigen ligase family protein [Tautonia rosea]
MKGLIFTLLLTYGGAATSLFKPFIGLLVYIAFAILRPDYLWAHSLPQGGRYSLVVALGLLMGWTLHGFGSWSFGRAKGVVTAMLGFWVCLVIAGSACSNPDHAWRFMVEPLSKVLLPCLAAITLIDSLEKLKQVTWVMAICLGYLALEFNQQYYQGQINPNEWNFGGAGDNNFIALYMVIGTAMAFFLGLESKVRWQKLLAFGMMPLMAHVVLFSMSRGGMLALAVVGLVSFLIIPKRPIHYGVFFLSILIVLGLAGPSVQEEFATIFVGDENLDESAKSRIDHWKACIDAMVSDPLTGIGPAHFTLYAHEFGFTEGKMAHTTWVLYGAELGAPAMLFILSFYGLCIVRLWPYTRTGAFVPDPWYAGLARMVIASLTGFIIAAQFLPSTGVEPPFYVAIIGAGVLKLVSLHRWDEEGAPYISEAPSEADEVDVTT